MSNDLRITQSDLENVLKTFKSLPGYRETSPQDNPDLKYYPHIIIGLICGIMGCIIFSNSLVFKILSILLCIAVILFFVSYTRNETIQVFLEFLKNKIFSKQTV